MFTDNNLEALIDLHRYQIGSGSSGTQAIGHGIVAAGALLAMAVIRAAKILATRDEAGSVRRTEPGSE